MSCVSAWRVLGVQSCANPGQDPKARISEQESFQEKREEAYQRHAQDLGEGVGGAASRSEADGGIGRLKPGLLAGPHDVTEGQDGSAEAQGWPIDGHHDGLLKLDEGLHEVPGGDRRACNR